MHQADTQQVERPANGVDCPRVHNFFSPLSPRGVLFLLVSILAVIPIQANSADRPSIIFILADDLGYGDLSCYPNSRPGATPMIDRLAREGVRMTHAYAAFPVCSPTRTALMTGRYPQRDGVYGNADGSTPGARAELEFLPVRLKQAGYRTGWLGKWHLGWDVANHPVNHGFDVSFGFLGGMHDYFDPREGDHYLGGPFAKNAWVFDGIKPVATMEYLTRAITRRAIEFVRTTPADQPFFLFLAYNAPHTPLQAPDDAILRHLRRDEEPVEAVRRAMIDELDSGVGAVMDALRDSGREKETLVIFTSDNGGTGREHNGAFRGGKMSLWEGGIRVPLIASWPGHLPAGRSCESMAITHDLTATTLSLAGVAVPADRIDGVDLMGYWTGQKTGDAHDWLAWSLGPKGGPGTKPTIANTERWSVRRGPWKLVRDGEKGASGLFDLSQDESESKNLEPDHEEKVAELTAIFEGWLATTAPACGPIQRTDTRPGGDDRKLADLREHCRRLLEEKKPAP